MSKHTPETWYILDDGTIGATYIMSEADDDNAIADVFGRTEEEEMANANLIAAAPDLLDALMRMVYTYSPADEYEIRSLAIAKAVIAKATGESQ